MPRRYHRPPASKRRKPKRPQSETVPVEPRPVDGGVTASVPADDTYDEEWDDAEEFEDEPAATAVATAVRPAAGRERIQHLQRDFSYVRTELIRVAAVGSFLVISLIITAILR